MTLAVAFTVLWLIMIGWFTVVEIAAIVRPEGGDTLSEHVRLWFDTKNASGPLWKQRRWLFAALMIWFFIHIWVDLPGPF